MDKTTVPAIYSTIFISTTEDYDEIQHTDMFIGCLLAIGGNLLISVSLNLQKYTHTKNTESGCPVHYTRLPLWWLGLALMGLGELGNFTAYGFAPASLVAPLGTTTVIVNAFIAVIFLKEDLKTEDLFGGSLAIIGAFFLITFSSKSDILFDADILISYLSETAFIVYMSIEVALVIGLLIMLYHFKIENVVIVLLICNIFASFTVIASKGVSSMIQVTFAGDNQLVYGIFWVMLIGMACAIVVQINFLNKAMALNDSSIVVPTNFVFFTISAMLAGIIFYKEFSGLSVEDAFMFLFGCLMCFIGVYFITIGRTTVLTVEPDIQEAEMDPERLATKIFPAWMFPSILRGEALLKRSGFMQTSSLDLRSRLPPLDLVQIASDPHQSTSIKYSHHNVPGSFLCKSIDSLNLEEISHQDEEVTLENVTMKCYGSMQLN